MENFVSPDKQLVDILALLVERFGTGRTLGETYATLYALMVLRAGGVPSVTEIAKATGCSKQSLSRWLQYQVEIGQAATQPADDDARKQEIAITDPMWAYRHVPPLAEILGCEVDQPQRKKDFNAS